MYLSNLSDPNIIIVTEVQEIIRESFPQLPEIINTATFKNAEHARMAQNIFNKFYFYSHQIYKTNFEENIKLNT